MFTQETAPNSDPTARNRPQMSALNLGGAGGLGGLLSGLFGGGGAAPSPAPPPPPAAAAVAAPDGTLLPVDATGRRPPIVPGLNPSGDLVLAGGNSPGQGIYRSTPVPYPPRRV